MDYSARSLTWQVRSTEEVIEKNYKNCVMIAQRPRSGELFRVFTMIASEQSALLNEQEVADQPRALFEVAADPLYRAMLG
jgi:hypothetical protein